MSTDIPNPDAPGSEQPEPEFNRLPDLASRALGGSVVWANDELPFGTALLASLAIETLASLAIETMED